MAVYLGQIDDMEKKEKKAVDKKATVSKVEEPALSYLTSTKLGSLSSVLGTAKVGNFNPISRSLALMGMVSEVSFSEVRNDLDWIGCIRVGVPKKALDNIMDVTGISVQEISQIIGTSDRTLRRYSSAQKLNPEQSERVIELARLYSRGEEVFGNLESFKVWMNNPVPALGNKTPKTFLDTSLGIDMLMDEIGRIEQGVFA